MATARPFDDIVDLGLRAIGSTAFTAGRCRAVEPKRMAMQKRLLTLAGGAALALCFSVSSWAQGSGGGGGGAGGAGAGALTREFERDERAVRVDVLRRPRERLQSLFGLSPANCSIALSLIVSSME